MPAILSYGPASLIALIGIFLLISAVTGGDITIFGLPVPKVAGGARIATGVLGTVLMLAGGVVGFFNFADSVARETSQVAPTMIMPTMDMSNYVTKTPPTMDMGGYIKIADAQATLAAQMVVVSGPTASSMNGMPTDTVQAAATQKVTADTSTWPKGFAETVGTHLTYATQIVLMDPDKYGYWQQDYNKLKAIEGQHPEYKDFIEYILKLGWTY